jgi:hypothetical protein
VLRRVARSWLVVGKNGPAWNEVEVTRLQFWLPSVLACAATDQARARWKSGVLLVNQISHRNGARLTLYRLARDQNG